MDKRFIHAGGRGIGMDGWGVVPRELYTHVMSSQASDEPIQTLARLAAFMGRFEKARHHDAGVEFTGVMLCLLLHSKSVADSLLALHDKWGTEWFPSTVGFVLARSLFEIDVTAHYITQDPSARASLYLGYQNVINKKRLEAVRKHSKSAKPDWSRGLSQVYASQFQPDEKEIERRYAAVLPDYPEQRGNPANNWSGKSIGKMAADVGHEEAYAVYYSDLSNFAHVNVELAGVFDKTDKDGIFCSQRADPDHVAKVFGYGAIFLSCFLKLFGSEMKTWTEDDVDACWNPA